MGDLEVVNTPSGKRIRARIRVRLADTDAQGVVYYGNFFTYFEVGRLGLVRTAGFDLARPGSDGNFYIVSATCDYKSFARYFDLLLLETYIQRLGRSSVHFYHLLMVIDDGEGASPSNPRLCAEAHDTLVWLNPDLRPSPIPPWLRRSLEDFVQRDTLWYDGRPRHWTVAVGSSNPVKIRAAQEVLGRIDPSCRVQGTSGDIELPRQPWGYEQTRGGALKRAQWALADPAVDLGIGMETGLVERDGKIYLISWCAVVHRDGWTSTAAGAEMPLPAAVSAQLSPQNPGVELGTIVEQWSGHRDVGKNAGTIGIMTRGLLNRQKVWEHSLIYALAPVMSDTEG